MYFLLDINPTDHWRTEARGPKLADRSARADDGKYSRQVLVLGGWQACESGSKD